MEDSKVIEKLIEHDERLDRIEKNMVTKLEFHELTDTMDKAMVILQRLDQERVFTSEWIRRIEGDVQRIKEHLHIN